MSSKQTLYTCEIIFHRAEHVPIGDLPDFSSDPYIEATLEVPNVHPTPNLHPPYPLIYRTPTVRRTLNPIYNARWIVSGIPHSGFTLTLRLIDEDPADRDDRLGKVILHLPKPESGEALQEGWHTGETEYKVEKRRGSIQAHIATYLASMVTRGSVSHHARIWVSVRVIAKANNQEDRRIFTVGPPKYVQHFSPLIGRLISGGTAKNQFSAKGQGDKSLSTSTFIANRLQLTGPPPMSLRHRYVGYAPFIKSLFKKSGVRGKVLNYALHRQFHTVYGYDKNTIYGVAGEGNFDTKSHAKNKEKETTVHAGGDSKAQENEDAKLETDHEAKHGQDSGVNLDADGSPKPNSDNVIQDNTADRSSPSQPTERAKAQADALAHQFLYMTSHGTAGRLFTYVITLDSEWRFTETGEEFSVDLLSKHSMHANVAKEIAFSGEFFVRRMQYESGSQSQGQDTETAEAIHKDSDESVSDNLKDYELVIDNDSGTYRPKKELLPKLQEWLGREDNLGALGKVTAMDGFDETLKKWKEERQAAKRQAKGLKPRPKKEDGKDEEQDDGGDDGDAASGNLGRMVMPKRKGSSVSSISSGKLGSRAGSLSSSDVEAVMKEDAKRARDNEDDDKSALSEERKGEAEAGEKGGKGKGKEKQDS